MKKKICLILTVVLIFASVFCLSACDATQGKDGLSAYEIAVKNGFTGTEKEWLESISVTTTVEKETNNFNVDIKNSGDVSLAANTGLKSIVSVYSKFTVIQYVGWPFTQQQEVQAKSAGSGVIYQLESDGSAYIITNHHVVYEHTSTQANHISDDINIYLYGLEGDNYAIPAKYVGGSMNYDIAVLRVNKNEILKNAIERKTVAAVSFANSDEIKIGQTSIAIGNPEALGISVTSGIVCVDSEYITMKAVDNSSNISLRVIRTDTAVNSGNSGGGLFDANGKLIGVVNAKVSDSSVENIAYAIPSNVAKSIADNIIEYNKSQGSSSVMRVMLGVGVNISEMTAEIDETTGYIKKIEKTIIGSVNNDSIVKDKLKAGDRILSVKVDERETKITRQYQFIDALLDARVGSVIKIKFMRDNSEQEVSLTVTSNCIAVY